VLGGTGTLGGVFWARPPLLEVRHAPERFARRTGDLSANLRGVAFEWADLRYRVNAGTWRPIALETSTTPRSQWTIELLPGTLREGPNRVDIEASAPGRRSVFETVRFEYDGSLPSLPLLQDWSEPLDVQYGLWEVVEDDGVRRVRPVPSTEGYDAIALASGSFPGGRRVETEIIFRSFPTSAMWAGFGVLTMWGGHNEPGDHRPRRGWEYAVAWYMKPYGAWCEFSTRSGDGQRHDAFAGETWPEPEPDSRWSLVAEAWPETDARGNHLNHRQRMKLWPAGEPEPAEWLETAERGDARLPPGEYAVAVVALEAQVEFAPLRISALPARVREDAGPAIHAARRAPERHRESHPPTLYQTSSRDASSAPPGIRVGSRAVLTDVEPPRPGFVNL
jgi:hypothetical protein